MIASLLADRNICPRIDLADGTAPSNKTANSAIG